MARTALTPITAAFTGANAPAVAANADGNMVPPSSIVMVINGSGGSINVTISTPATVQGLAVAEQVTAVPAGESRFFGPFPAEVFAQVSGADAGQVYIDYSAVTTVTVRTLAV
jgi:hypothetical protein